MAPFLQGTGAIFYKNFSERGPKKAEISMIGERSNPMKKKRHTGPRARGPPGKKDEYVLRDSEHRIVLYNPPSAPSG